MSISQYNTLNAFLIVVAIRMTVLLEYFDLFDNVAVALTWGPLTRWGLATFPLFWGN